MGSSTSSECFCVRVSGSECVRRVVVCERASESILCVLRERAASEHEREMRLSERERGVATNEVLEGEIVSPS